MNPASQIIRGMAVILIAAVCLGFAYDAASPLGVRISGDAVAPALPAMPAAAPDSAIENETLAATIFLDDTATAPPASGAKLPVAMSWAEVKPLLAKGEIVLVDARDSIAYEEGHIPGAVSLPMATFNDRIAEFVTRVPNTTTLVIYCASIRCRLAHEEALLLSGQYAFADVREMPCGYVEWIVAESHRPPAPGGAR
ncbi:MAG: rhodanese-like domain-containing protein [Chthoniobacteraceae bacterium]